MRELTVEENHSGSVENVTVTLSVSNLQLKVSKLSPKFLQIFSNFSPIALCSSRLAMHFSMSDLFCLTNFESRSPSLQRTKDHFQQPKMAEIIPPDENPVTVVVWIQGQHTSTGKILTHIDWWPHVSSDIGSLGWKPVELEMNTTVGQWDEQYFTLLCEFVQLYVMKCENHSVEDDRCGEMVKIAVKEIKIWNGNPNPDMKNINSYAVEFFSNKGVLGIPISLTEEYEEDWVQHMILDGISIHCETQDIQFVGKAQNKCQAEHDIVLGPTVVELCCDISITSHLSDGSDSDEEW